MHTGACSYARLVNLSRRFGRQWQVNFCSFGGRHVSKTVQGPNLNLHISD